MKKEFLRSKWRTMSKLGKRRKKKQKWRRPKGRDTQMRLQKKGNPKVVKIGYKKKKKTKDVEIIRNLKDLEKVGKRKKVLLGKIGKKKKIEMIKEAEKKDIKIINLNTKKFLEKMRKEKKIKEQVKKEKEDKEKEKAKEEKKTEKKEEKKKEDKDKKEKEK